MGWVWENFQSLSYKGELGFLQGWENGYFPVKTNKGINGGHYFVTDGTKLLVRSVCEKKILFLGPPPVYQDLSTCHDWPVKDALVYLPIRLKGNLKRTSGNSSSLLRAQNRDISAASQVILTRVRLHPQCRLGWSSKCTRKEDYDDPFLIIWTERCYMKQKLLNLSSKKSRIHNCLMSIFLF